MASKPDPGGAARHCVVIGGGLAGLSAACDLLDRGWRVTLLEKRPFLGGRAYSFTDPETGQEVDNGQHVFLGCCTAYIGFLERLGVLDRTRLQPRLRAPVMDGAGTTGAISSAPWLPAPLHLLPAFVAYPHLSLGDKLRAVPALLRALLVDPDRHRDSLERRTFGDWLRDHGQSPRAIRSLWELIGLPTLNDSVEAASAYMGLMVFREGLLKSRHGGDIGYARVGLTALISDAAHDHITRHGGEIRSGRAAARIVVEDGRATGVEMGGASRSGEPADVLPADAVVCATPWDAVADLLPPEWSTHPAFAPARGLEASPIVGVHIWYDRPVMDEEFTAVLDSPVQWVFNKSRIQGLQAPGQYVCISLSGAWEFAPMGKEALRDLFLTEMARLFPAARGATVERFITVKQLTATFRSTPGAEAHRLPQRTPMPNLALAGDWTRTGWPSTMESAVRSGRLAAEALEGERREGGVSGRGG